MSLRINAVMMSMPLDSWVAMQFCPKKSHQPSLIACTTNTARAGDPGRAAESPLSSPPGLPWRENCTESSRQGNNKRLRHFVPQPWSCWSPWPQEAPRTTADKCSTSMPKCAGWRNSVLLRLGRVCFIRNVPINTYFSAAYTKEGNFHYLLPCLQPCFWNGL